METVRSGARPWVNLDVLHRIGLDEVLRDLQLELPDADRDELTRAWHRLDPWPDVVPGLWRMKATHIIAPCSNGHIAQSVNLAKHAGLPWDAIVGAELAHAYKPDPEVYLRSVEVLGLEPRDVCMVACHNGDLQAAAALGLKTAFVPRTTEHGPQQTTDLEPTAEYDFAAPDFRRLAALL
jgi:2-haloacid dehalogenase